MLEVVGPGASPTRLLEALERLGVSRGAELRAPDGPGGSPDAELIREFEAALNAPLEGGVTGDAPDGGAGMEKGMEQDGGRAAGAASPDAPAISSVAPVSPDFVNAPEAVRADAADASGAAHPVRSVNAADSADAAARPAEPVNGAERADFSVSGGEEPRDEAGPAASAAIEPGPAERMPGEAVLRYERLEMRPGTAAGAESAFSPEAARVEPFEGTRGMRRVGPKAVSVDSGSGMAVEGKKLPEFSGPDDGVRRGGIRDDVQEVARLLERVTGGNLSAVELYRLQYLVGMLQVQASSGSKVSQQAGQGIESLLKQQG